MDYHYIVMMASSLTEEAALRTYFLHVLANNNYSRTRTAAALDISLRTVTSRIARYRDEGYSVPDNPHAPTSKKRQRRRRKKRQG